MLYLVLGKGLIGYSWMKSPLNRQCDVVKKKDISGVTSRIAIGSRYDPGFQTACVQILALLLAGFVASGQSSSILVSHV